MHQLLMKRHRELWLLTQNCKKVVFVYRPKKFIKRARAQCKILHTSYRKTDFYVYQILKQTTCRNHIKVWTLFVKYLSKAMVFGEF